jgi:hypothetical protein
LAEVGRLSTLAGCASDLFSLASDAAVTWAIMKPRIDPGISLRNGGRRDTLASINMAMRRSASAPTSATATAIVSAASATVRRGNCRRTAPRLVGKDQRIVGDRVGLAQQHLAA